MTETTPRSARARAPTSPPEGPEPQERGLGREVRHDDHHRPKALADHGVSIWLDDLSRERLRSGNLQQLIDPNGIVGVTTNPSIFQAALSKGDRYNDRSASSRMPGRASTRPCSTSRRRTSVTRATSSCRSTTRPGRRRARVDRGRPAPRARHRRGRSTRPRPSRPPSTAPTSSSRSPRPVEGLPGDHRALAEGICGQRDPDLLARPLPRRDERLPRRASRRPSENGKDLSKIQSVASFFVSRVDTEIDKRLDAIGSDEARALRGKAGVANARLAYQAYEEVFSTPRWGTLADEGANPQRPLWASTGVKDPAYPDTIYVTELVAPGTVNTMPEKTLEATADHGEVTGDTGDRHYAEAAEVLDGLERARHLLHRGRPPARARGRRQVREVVG